MSEDDIDDFEELAELLAEFRSGRTCVTQREGRAARADTNAV